MKKFNYRSYRAFFKFYTKLPLILLFLTVLLFFAWGIADSIIFQTETWLRGEGTVLLYGIMQLRQQETVWLVWSLIGLIVGLIFFIAMLISISYRVLVIANLEKISGVLQPPVPTSKS